MSTANPADDPSRRADNYPPLNGQKMVGPLRPNYAAIKMVIEWPVALACFLIAAPVMTICMLLVRCTSPGPVLYRQTRLGRGGRAYDMLKIRTMTHNCEATTGAIWSGPMDRRVTRIGRFLRDTHLDELPQLWHVVRCEMSLIGPRPERPELVARIERVLPRYRDRLQIRPGLTGFAQIQHTADLSLDHVRRKLMYDLYYVREMSLWLDLRIAIGTGFYFLGMTLRAIGKLAVRSHGHVVEKVIENEEPLQVEDEEKFQLRATG
ncbi:hypothetical protein BH09PLA1_BH09PLA1_12390 [soil metagenome]